MDKLQIEYKSTEKLIPYVNNPRDNKQAVDQVAASIQEFGFKNPIIVDKNNVIVAGHTRLLAAQKLNIEEVPTIKADDLTENQIKAFRIADNKTAEFAEWDFDKLAIEIDELGGMFTGFSEEEVEEFKELEVDDGDFDEEGQDDLEPNSREGDIYKLGNHRLMCGSSTSREDMAQLMDGELADLVITDPPYNVNYEGGTGLKIKNDHMAEDEFQQFILDAFTQMKQVMRKGAAYYIWYPDTRRYAFSKALLELDMGERQTLIWVKSSLVMGRQDYQWIHEACLYGWKPGDSHYFINDFTNTTVYDNVENVNKMSEEQMKAEIKALRKELVERTTIYREDKPSANAVHPTMKPLELGAQQIVNSTRPEESVLDIFGGSGSTLMAAEQLGRKCYTMELDPHYVDVIIDRWEEHTGEEAELIQEGGK